MPELKSIKSYGLNRDALTSISEGMLDATIDLYNEQYNAGYTIETIPDSINELIGALIGMSLFGWQDMDKSKFSDQTLVKIAEMFGSEYQNYKGIDNATQQAVNSAITINSNQSLSEEQIKKIAEQRSKEVTDGFATALFHAVTESLATNDGKEYVGAITRGDDRVRPKHEENQMKYWRVGEFKPMHDYNCRCFYQYGSQERLEQLGFTRKTI